MTGARLPQELAHGYNQNALTHVTPLTGQAIPPDRRPKGTA